MDPEQSAGQTAADMNNKLANVDEATAVLQAQAKAAPAAPVVAAPAPVAPEAAVAPATTPEGDVIVSAGGKRYRLKKVAPERQAEVQSRYDEWMAQQGAPKALPVTDDSVDPEAAQEAPADGQLGPRPVDPTISPRPVGGGLLTFGAPKITGTGSGKQFTGPKGERMLDRGAQGLYNMDTGETVPNPPKPPTAAEKKAELAAKTAEEKKGAMKEHKAEQSNIVLRQMSSLYDNLSQIPAGGGAKTVAQKIGSINPKSPQALFDKAKQTLLDKLAVDELQTMRQNSPTGGALGNPSNADIQLLRNQAGSVDWSGDRNLTLSNMADVLLKSIDVVYGTDAELDAAVVAGKATPEEVAESKRQKADARDKVVLGAYHKQEMIKQPEATKK